MLSKNQVVAARKAVEKLYDGTCTVMEQQKYIKANQSTGFRDVAVLEGIPCRLSFSSTPAASQGESHAELAQEIKVFLAPELEVKPGSKLVITQNGVTGTYRNSGKPAVYATHQEISLELWEERT